MSKVTQVERLAVVETKLKNVETTVNDINSKLDVFIASAVTHAQLNERLDEHKEIVKRLEVEIQEAKRKNTLLVWMTGMFSAGAGAALTAMVTELIRR